MMITIVVSKKYTIEKGGGVMVQGDIETLIMQLIMNSGNAKSLAMEAIKSARCGQLGEAEAKINEASEAINLAHTIQTKLLTLEASGENFNFSLLLTHSQDHMMNTITTIDLAKEFVYLWKSLKGEKN